MLDFLRRICDFFALLDQLSLDIQINAGAKHGSMIDWVMLKSGKFFGYTILCTQSNLAVFGPLGSGLQSVLKTG